ncbi:hypothetical protein [Thioalkalivibrio paradoxus]|uniref:Uncharacterized protein n=1 Tax=Thioalkalivibrio paradoxus ARh 1 TaxID=713585 RepID=W0DN04_9GAMM|nr:hypothetical protein [Thioalkalivibrio paradoxus]AHE99831.1 hypothetical protein THITH_01260 [Thioalkalivibrio paradoxus ARh 1]
MLVLQASLNHAQRMLRIIDSASGQVVTEWRGVAVDRVLASAGLTTADLATATGTAAPARVLRSLLFEALVADFVAPGATHRGPAEVIPLPRCRAGQNRARERPART